MKLILISILFFLCSCEVRTHLTTGTVVEKSSEKNSPFEVVSFVLINGYRVTEIKNKRTGKHYILYGQSGIVSSD